jgi:hypothetical protein
LTLTNSLEIGYVIRRDKYAVVMPVWFNLIGGDFMTKVMSITTRVCDKFAARSIAPAQQREIAALAYQFWLARGFRNGSPQEDWLRAQRAVKQERRRA